MTPCGGPAGVEADKIRTELGINYHMVRKESADPKLTVSCGPHCRNTIMKLTKNAAALLLAASLAVSVCATPVFAENPPVKNGTDVQSTGESITTPTAEKQACTQLKYTVTEGYTWSIPADINFGQNNTVTAANKTETGKVTVKNCKIKQGYTLKIKMAGNGGQYSTETTDGFKIKTADDASLEYDVQKGTTTLTNVLSGGEVLELVAGNDNAEETLTFTLKTQKSETNAAEIAGEYIGYAIFTAQATTNT